MTSYDGTLVWFDNMVKLEKKATLILILCFDGGRRERSEGE